MTLHPSQLAVLGTGSTSGLKSTSTESKKSTGTSFSAALKDATSTATDSKTPEGETTQGVEGHKYADILTGPRKGMYLNTGSNKRAGQAFVLVRKNGREYHIYGTGKNRVVIGMKTKAEKDATTTPTTTDTSSSNNSSTPTGTTDAGKITTDTGNNS
jgi:hypothetical protein